MKIITVIGARPQFIKAAAVSAEISKHNSLTEIIVHTGQHYDENMSDIFFREMNIPEPAYRLEINQLSHGAMTGRMLEQIERILVSEKPDLVLVYGDTNSTLAGALAASKLHIRVGHIEAGLRSFNMQMPEEINRILTDRISDLLFCPTDTAVDNLVNEGFKEFDCLFLRTGDVMQDASIMFAEHMHKPGFAVPDKFVLATVHRQENTDQPERIREIFDSLTDIAEELPIILPVHPRTRKMAESSGINLEVKGITIAEPVGYFEMLYLISRCTLVMTDSGGLQKEAFFFEKPCVTLRDETEWTELTDYGYNQLAGADKEKIKTAFRQMLEKDLNYKADLYGGGKASHRIVKEIIS